MEAEQEIIYLDFSYYDYLVEVAIIHIIQNKIIITNEYKKILDNNLLFVIESNNSLINELNIFRVYIKNVLYPACEFTLSDNNFISDLYNTIDELKYQKNFFRNYRKNKDYILFNFSITNFIDEHNRIMTEYCNNFN